MTIAIIKDIQKSNEMNNCLFTNSLAHEYATFAIITTYMKNYIILDFLFKSYPITATPVVFFFQWNWDAYLKKVCIMEIDSGDLQTAGIKEDLLECFGEKLFVSMLNFLSDNLSVTNTCILI